MKKFVKKLPLVAFVFALVAAFAFNVPAKDDAVVAHWFALDDSGAIGAPMSSAPSCNGPGDYCAVAIDDSQLDSSGEPLFENVTDEDAVYLTIRREN